jgi:hypothetical protein
MPLSPYAPPDLSSPTYRDQLDYIVCEDGRAIGRMYDDRRRREQRSPTAWSATSNPRSLTKQIQPAPLMPMARAAAGVAAHERAPIINGHRCSC